MEVAKRYCIDCKQLVGWDELIFLGMKRSKEGVVAAGICRKCYGPEWHKAIYEDEDDYVDELVNEALEKL